MLDVRHSLLDAAAGVEVFRPAQGAQDRRTCLPRRGHSDIVRQDDACLCAALTEGATIA